MRAKKFEQRDTPARQKQILDAALECYARLGFDRTTIQDIRRASGASIGSIYHHFGDKEGVFAALYLEAIQDYQTRMVEALAPDAGALEGVEAIVGFHLKWVVTRPEKARFMFETRNRFFMGRAEPDLAALNQRWGATIRAWLERHQASGTFRIMPMIEAMAVLLGPCQEMTRLWLEQIAPADLERYAPGLARAAWAALRAPGPAP